jgi:hypothetical protein
MTEETVSAQKRCALAPANLQDAPWRQYPHLDAAIEIGNSPVIAQIERTWNEAVRLSESGTAREQERARTVTIAYCRVLELYRRLVELRNQVPSTEVSNLHGGAAIKH